MIILHFLALCNLLIGTAFLIAFYKEENHEDRVELGIRVLILFTVANLLK